MMKKVVIVLCCLTSLVISAKQTISRQQRSTPSRNRLTYQDPALKQKREIQQCLAGRPLPGLFGMKFGEQIEIENQKAINEKKSSIDDWTYEFIPAKKFRDVNKGIVTVTPISHRVWRISTWYQPTSGLSIKDEAKLVESIFAEKFHKKTNVIEIPELSLPATAQFPRVSVWTFLFPGNAGKIGRVVKVSDFGKVRIIAEDIEEKKLAEQEWETAKKEKVSDSVKRAVKNDADAL